MQHSGDRPRVYDRSGYGRSTYGYLEARCRWVLGCGLLLPVSPAQELDRMEGHPVVGGQRKGSDVDTAERVTLQCEPLHIAGKDVVAVGKSSLVKL